MDSVNNNMAQITQLCMEMKKKNDLLEASMTEIKNSNR